MRYTEYHAGVPVIKDKALLKDAMKKLAKYEDKEEKPIPREEMLYALKGYCSNRYCDECIFNHKNCGFKYMDYDRLKTAYEMMLEAQNKR